MRPEITALVLTEDGSKYAQATLKNLCIRVFDLIAPQFEQGQGVRFQPAADDGRKAMTANKWKSAKARDQRKIRDLCQNIATYIARPDGFVFFHFDGDQVWSPGSQSENLRKFTTIIEPRVREILRGRFKDTAQLEYAMSKLIHVAPHYSIETWLFECEQDPYELDRALKPKDLAAIDTSRYPELAKSLPARVLCELGTSFCDLVTSAGGCSPLVIRLRQHWPDWLASQYGLARNN